MHKKHYRRHADEEAVLQDKSLSPETKKSIFIIILLVVAFLSFLAFFDLAGSAGTFIKRALEFTLGWGAFLLPVVLLLLGYFLLLPEKYAVAASHYFGLFFFILSYSGLLQFAKDLSKPTEFLTGAGGGYLGYIIYLPLQRIMGSIASPLVLAAVFLISLLIIFNTSLHTLAARINIFNLFRRKITKDNKENDEEDWETDEETTEENWPANENKAAAAENETTEETSGDFTKKKITPAAPAKVSSAPLDNLKVTFSKGRRQKVDIPLSLLEGRTGKPTSGDIKTNADIIKQTLEDFGIAVEMGEVNVGATVTQFTLKPAEGIKLSRITALQNDLALALAAHPIRLEAPIPGKALVGVEVPNQSIAIVKLKDILANPEFKNKKGRLKIALGEDVSGRAWVIALANMPHLLIAGATGSGKSVCINNVIISLLYQYSPDQLKMIIVDPKKVELTNYNGIPHLLTPVITEVDKTINALRWTVREMDERFRLLNLAGKRNIDAYNASVLVNRLPYIVVIIDELADLMSMAARDVEAAIVRLAQMARAVGIHLIVATQRPSVNVITGLIKANITARIAFAVASSIDSRTILDVSGAEKLLGKGDLLFSSAEISKPRRIQGAYLNDDEIERVIDFWKRLTEPEYNEEIIESRGHSSSSGNFNNGPDGDELLEEAKDTVVRAGKASASLLQRRLRVGYARAARLLDLLEEQGIIGPGDGAKPREVLISDNDYAHIPAETTSKYAVPETEEEEIEAGEETAAEETDEADDSLTEDDEENKEEEKQL
ncbi:MAG: DNA translocase FtsK 4TM domain-containing protein [Candidatus Komeilibacteria bacterium]|nr:DNA translocase FtsK 4TM domain-containing protein [Candidatus Komeilibacteria bacterium]